MILDTNVITELMKPEPSRVVLEFLDRLDSDGLYTTSISVAEIGMGLALLRTRGGKPRIDRASYRSGGRHERGNLPGSWVAVGDAKHAAFQ